MLSNRDIVLIPVIESSVESTTSIKQREAVSGKLPFMINWTLGPVVADENSAPEAFCFNKMELDWIETCTGQTKIKTNIITDG